MQRKKFKSEYHWYKEIVYKVVEHGLGIRNIYDAIDEIKVCGTSTLGEILDLADVAIEGYREDCVNLYIFEIELRLGSAEYQLKKAKEYMERSPA
ncbi:hypothetical protein A8L34_28065 [Bacillus sp. FJAT-27264]|uniref:hypothetical protein n=1 Tax=Paenibacillus sp. (strain DSM 101736 / FJAT-27264) TaxID=1850362 RepID=UPI000807B33B|nr:hypothetical protein [Bacillus sp. FJAT-27264]OBZ15905.1 hypothetical protein A8L34_28065 [Bacillus sp. FJAT-27264]